MYLNQTCRRTGCYWNCSLWGKFMCLCYWVGTYSICTVEHPANLLGLQCLSRTVLQFSSESEFNTKIHHPQHWDIYVHPQTDGHCPADTSQCATYWSSYVAKRKTKPLKWNCSKQVNEHPRLACTFFPTTQYYMFKYFSQNTPGYLTVLLIPWPVYTAICVQPLVLPRKFLQLNKAKGKEILLTCRKSGV